MRLNTWHTLANDNGHGKYEYYLNHKNLSPIFPLAWKSCILQCPQPNVCTAETPPPQLLLQASMDKKDDISHTTPLRSITLLYLITSISPTQM